MRSSAPGDALPHLRQTTEEPVPHCPVTHAGDLPSPVPAGWVSIASWPKREGVAVTHPAPELFDALQRRWTTDAHVQLLSDAAPTEPGRAYRFSQSLLAHPHAEHVHLVATVADLDREHHAPWTSRAGAVLAVEALRDAYPDAAAIYSTRAGVRLLWLLPSPVPVRFARSYIEQLHAALRTRFPAHPALGSLTWDDSAAEWTRIFRLPRVRRDGVDLDPVLRVSPDARFEWTPSALVEETLGAPAPVTGPVPPIGNVPADLPPPPSDWPAWISRSSAAGRVLEVLAGGHPWGPPAIPLGTRNTALKVAVNSVAYQLRRGGPAPTPGELFAIFAPSVRAELARDPTADGEAKLWKFANASAAAESARRAAAVTARDGTPGDELPKLVTHGDGVGYVLREDGRSYAGPLRGSEIYVALREWHAGSIALTRPNGRTLRSVPELLVGHAAAAESVELYYPTDDEPVPWVASRRAVRVRTLSRPHVEPVESPAVAEWLDALLSEAGPAVADRVLDWLATAHRLDRQTSALYLQGPPELGKGLFALGVASLWGAAPVAFSEATRGFNDGLLRSPVVLLDEGALVDRQVSSAFRSLVGQTQHRIEAKNKPVVTLHGCPRVIVAANNPYALDLRGQHEADDLDAVAQRILHVPLSSRARELLRDLGGMEGTRHWVTRPDGSPGDLPCHIAWLASTRQAKPGGRFLVEGVPTVYHLRLLTGDPLYAGTLIAIAAALGPPAPTEPGGPGVFVRPGEGVAWVNPMRLHRRWQTLVAEDVPRPTVQRVAGALSALARSSSATLFEGVDGGSAACWPIGEDLVLRVATDLGYPDPHRVRAAFVKGTPNRPGGRDGTADGSGHVVGRVVTIS